MNDRNNFIDVIYYLDDSVELLEAFSLFAEAYGCKVVTYADPFIFLKEFQKHSGQKNILLVDLDFKLPTINGFGVIKTLKDYNYGGFKSVYLFTGQELDIEILTNLRLFDSRRVAYLKKTNENFLFLLNSLGIDTDNEK